MLELGTKSGRLTAELIKVWTDDVKMNRYFVEKVENEEPTSPLNTQEFVVDHTDIKKKVDGNLEATNTQH